MVRWLYALPDIIYFSLLTTTDSILSSPHLYATTICSLPAASYPTQNPVGLATARFPPCHHDPMGWPCQQRSTSAGEGGCVCSGPAAALLWLLRETHNSNFGPMTWSASGVGWWRVLESGQRPWSVAAMQAVDYKSARTAAAVLL